MPDVIEKALGILPPADRDEAVEELLARAHEELDAAAAERRAGADPADRLLVMTAILASVIPAAYAGVCQSVGLEEAAEEIREVAVVQAIEPSHDVPGRLLYIRIHKALIELHRRNGRFTRLGDNGSAIDVIKGASWLAGEIVGALETGRAELLVAPV